VDVESSDPREGPGSLRDHEVLRLLPTESSVHHSEFYPYFRKNAELIARFTPGYPSGVARHTEYLSRLGESRAALDAEAYGPGSAKIRRTDEYAIGIINAVANNEPYRFNGNVMNTGLITNLPNGSCVEVPCLVDYVGIHPCYVGHLPPQCAALNRQKLAGAALAVKGGLEGDYKAIEQAIALDSLTGAMLTLDQIRDMVGEIFAAEAEYLPQFQRAPLT
jgi:alpha-galactosidase